MLLFQYTKDKHFIKFLFFTIILHYQIKRDKKEQEYHI